MDFTVVNDLNARIQLVNSETALIELSHEIDDLISARILTNDLEIILLQQSMLIRANTFAIQGLVGMISTLSKGSPKRDEMH